MRLSGSGSEATARSRRSSSASSESSVLRFFVKYWLLMTSRSARPTIEWYSGVFERVLDVLGVGAGIGRLHVQLDADLLQLLRDELERLLRQRLRLGLVHRQREALAVLLADAVGSDLPAGVVEQLFGLLRVVRERSDSSL